MEFTKVINSRQSQRQYLPKAVEAEAIRTCVEAARIAPSACNAQPWKFIIVDDPALIKQIGEYAASLGMNKFCASAPAIAVMTLEKPNFTSAVGSVLKNKEYTLIDIGVAATHFCLQATDIGLSTCMIGWFNEKKIKKLLKIPTKKRVPLIITLGYPTGDQRPKVRKSIEEICSSNTY